MTCSFKDIYIVPTSKSEISILFSPYHFFRSLNNRFRNENRVIVVRNVISYDNLISIIKRLLSHLATFVHCITPLLQVIFCIVCSQCVATKLLCGMGLQRGLQSHLTLPELYIQRRNTSVENEVRHVTPGTQGLHAIAKRVATISYCIIVKNLRLISLL